jgi:hypothetical protein
MVRSDIIVALTNALERGYSLETATQVLTNSGYSANDINEAVNFINSGLSPVIIPSAQSQNSFQPLPSSQILPQSQDQTQPLPQMSPAVPKKESPLLLFLLVGVFVFLVIALIFVLIFQEPIVDFIKGIIG